MTDCQLGGPTQKKKHIISIDDTAIITPMIFPWYSHHNLHEMSSFFQWWPEQGEEAQKSLADANAVANESLGNMSRPQSAAHFGIALSWNRDLHSLW